MTGSPEGCTRTHSGYRWPEPYSGFAILTTNINAVEEAENSSGPAVGPFVCSPPCTQSSLIGIDLVLPYGAYVISRNGGLDIWPIKAEITLESIDNEGNTTGQVVTEYWERTLATKTPQRFTVWIEVPNLRWRASVRRLTPLSERPSDQSQMYWTGLKAVLGNYCGNSIVYDNTTLLVSKMKATEGISSDASNRVMVQATRLLNGVENRNPIDAFTDIFTNKHYGAGRPTSELNTTELAAIKAEVASCSFDAIFDQQTSVYEALKLTGQMIRGVPVPQGGLLTMVRDKPHTVPVAGFNEDNIISLNQAYIFSTTDEVDGLEGEYVDPLDSTKQYVTYPDTASTPEAIVLWGCTSRNRAQCVLEQLWKQRLYRRRLVSMDVEMDAYTLTFGDPINITHRLLGPSAVLHIVSSIRPKNEFTASIEAIRYDHRVYQ